MPEAIIQQLHDPVKSTGTKSSKAKSQTRKAAKQDAIVMRELYSDHRNIDKTLKAYETQLELYRAGKAFDLKLMHDVMSYLVLNPDQYHHPLEDTFFSLIAIKDIALKDEVEKTTDEHTLINEAGKALLECLNDQLRSPTSFKESHIIARSEKYISLLRGHIEREESLLFRPGSKLLTKRDWRELYDILHNNPDDPVFDENINENYLSLKQYLLERVEVTAEKLVTQDYRQLNQLIEGIVILSEGALEIGDVIKSHSKQAWQDTRDSYETLLNEDTPRLKNWLSTPLSCSLNGFDHYAESMAEIARILHKTSDSLVEETSQKKPKASSAPKKKKKKAAKK